MAKIPNSRECVGVDLNRNFNIRWSEVGEKGSYECYAPISYAAIVQVYYPLPSSSMAHQMIPAVRHTVGILHPPS